MYKNIPSVFLPMKHTNYNNILYTNIISLYYYYYLHHTICYSCCHHQYPHSYHHYHRLSITNIIPTATAVSSLSSFIVHHIVPNHHYYSTTTTARRRRRRNIELAPCLLQQHPSDRYPIRRINNHPKMQNHHNNNSTNDDDTIITSSSNYNDDQQQQVPKPLSIQELRHQRLIALGILNPIPIVHSNNFHDTSSNIPNDSSTMTATVTSSSTSSNNLKYTKTTTTTTTIPTTTTATTFDTNRKCRTNMKRNMKQTCEVIDLLSDDDDEDSSSSSHENNIHNVSNSKKRMKKTNQSRTNINDTSTTTTASTTINNQNQNNTDTTKGIVFQIATWNVWFGPNGDGSPYAKLRMKAIVQLLMNEVQQQDQQHTPLYCIGLQEVVSETIQYLQPLLEQYHYTIYQQPSSSSSSYRCAMAVHHNVQVLSHGFIPYTQTQMSRGFLYVHVQLPSISSSSNEMIFTTTHLESYANQYYTGAKQRMVQLQEMSQYVEAHVAERQQYQQQTNNNIDHTCVGIISGDMNWDDERIRKPIKDGTMDPNMMSLLSSNWIDTWLTHQSQSSSSIDTTSTSSTTTTKTQKQKKTSTTTTTTISNGYTYDSKLNPMLSGSLRRRFDRILLYHHRHPTIPTTTATNSHQNHIKVISTKLLGTDIIYPDITWEKYNSYQQKVVPKPLVPSDHFGYISTIQVSNSLI